MNENANTDFSSLCYTAFGDSITFGSDRSLSYAQMAHPYPEQVARLLKLASYDNRGVSGATFCENDLDRTCMTDNILSYREKTDIISVMLGVNDYSVALPLGENGDFSKRTVYGCLNMIAEHLTLVHGESFIFFMTPYKTARVSGAPYSQEDVANAVKEVAGKYGIPVLDMYSLGQYELEMNDAASDGIHPSAEFVTKYTAPQVAEFIRENYGKHINA